MGIHDMDETIINELNRGFEIYYPYEEISIYMNNSSLDDMALPTIASQFSIKNKSLPNRLMFRACQFRNGFSPDETTPLIDFKRENPGVSIKKLEGLYQGNLLAKYRWYEYFQPRHISWRDLLTLGNRLIERSATDYYVFLRFSLPKPNTMELITN